MRSLLYVPASEERFIAKAHLRRADCIILDLEDAVPEQDKPRARQMLADSVASVRQGGSRVAVRINAGRREDVAAAHAAGADLLVVPKLEMAADIVIAEGMDAIGIIESARGVVHAERLAELPGLVGLMTGSEDLALSLGAVPEPDVLRMPKLLVHYAAKAAGRWSFGLFRSIADYSNLEAIAVAAAEAKRHGFDGASCIHPSAVSVLNSEFLPREDEVAWAKRVLAVEKSRGTVDGRMVDRPVFDRAKRVLALAEVRSMNSN